MNVTNVSSHIQTAAYSSAGVQTEPTQPSAPTPPPGGNIENRKPPAKPSPPSGSSGHNINVSA